MANETYFLQLYCTHCTCGTSAIERATGARANHVLGYSARASSVTSVNELKEVYNSVRHLLSYSLPSDTSKERKAAITMASAPKRLVYVPDIGGRQVCAHVVYRAEDTTDSKRRSYFAHLILSPIKDRSLSAGESLRLWGSTQWSVEDSPSISWELPSLSSRALGFTSSQPINEKSLVGFLFDPCPSFFPDRWRKMPATQREAFFRKAFQQYIDMPDHCALVLFAEPSIAAIIFFGIAKMIPRLLGEKLSFSTYEDSLSKVITRLAAIALDSPESKIEISREQNSKQRHLDTYSLSPQLDSKEASSNAVVYADFALTLLRDARRRSMDFSALERKIIEVNLFFGKHDRNLEDCASLSLALDRVRESLRKQDDISKTDWDSCTAKADLKDFLKSVITIDLQKSPQPLEHSARLLASNPKNHDRLVSLFEAQSCEVVTQAKAFREIDCLKIKLDEPSFSIGQKGTFVKEYVNAKNRFPVKEILASREAKELFCESTRNGIEHFHLIREELVKKADRNLFYKLLFMSSKNSTRNFTRLLGNVIFDSQEWQLELLIEVARTKERQSPKDCATVFEKCLTATWIKTLYGLKSSRRIKEDIALLVASQHLVNLSEKEKPIKDLSKWSGLCEIILRGKNTIGSVPLLSWVRKRMVCFKQIRELKSDLTLIQELLDCESCESVVTWNALTKLVSVGFSDDYLASVIAANAPGTSDLEALMSFRGHLRLPSEASWKWFWCILIIAAVVSVTGILIMLLLDTNTTIIPWITRIVDYLRNPTLPTEP